MKYLILFLLFFILSCSSQFNIIRITSNELSIVDSCKNYISSTPFLNIWQKKIVEYNNIKVNQYYCILPIYDKKKDKEIGYYTLISKPYYSIIGRDSIINGEVQFLTIIKKDKK